MLTLLNYRYGVPGHKDSEFEALVAKAQGHDANPDGDEAPKLGINRPLLDKLTMVSPNLLEAAGVPVFKVPCVCVRVLARARACVCILIYVPLVVAYLSSSWCPFLYTHVPTNTLSWFNDRASS